MDVSIDYQALFPNCYLKIMFPGSVALNLHACMCFCFQHMTNKHSHVYLEMFICTPAFERETILMSSLETNKHVKNKNKKDEIMAVAFLCSFETL